MSEIETLLRGGADANTKDHKGFSLLMSFAQRGDINAVKALLHYGASIKPKDYMGYSALDYAIANNHLDVIKYLLENGAIVDNDSYMLAVRKGLKVIVHYFDTLDEDKQVFLKKKRY